MEALETKAREFATRAHATQQRKYTGVPYIEHPAAVVGLLRQINATEEQIAAGWLHDVVEDCGVASDTIYAEFGIKVGQLVDWLTDVSKPEDGNRRVRKMIDRNHTANASADAKTVKLADLIDNSSTITRYDPDFARVYMQEKRELLTVLTDGDPKLFKLASEIVSEYFTRHSQ